MDSQAKKRLLFIWPIQQNAFSLCDYRHFEFNKPLTAIAHLMSKFSIGIYMTRLTILAAICLTTFFNAPTINNSLLFAQDKGSAEQPESKINSQLETPSKETKEAIQATFKKLKDKFDDSNFVAAKEMMTAESWDNFSGGMFLTAIEMTPFASQEDPALGRRMKKLLAKYGLDKIELPESFSDPTGGMIDEAEFDKAMDKLSKVITDENKEAAAVKELFDATKEFAFGINPFEGSITKFEGDDQSVSTTVEVTDGEFDMPPQVLTFKKSKQGWVWDGFDDDKTAELTSEWEGDFPVMPEPLPLIKDIELKGKSLSGKDVDLKDYKGKLVLVDFWGTWCPPCVASLPNLKKLHVTFKEHGFEIIGVANDQLEEVKEFNKKAKLPWENIIDGRGKIADEYGVQAFPTTLLIDKEGKHYKSDLHGVQLVDEIIRKLELDPKKYESLRQEFKKADAAHSDGDQPEADKSDGDGKKELQIGFGAADANNDDQVSAEELDKYLSDRLKDDELPQRKVFNRLDDDKNGFVSDSEFDNRHDVITHFMGEDYFGGALPLPADPGIGYVPFLGLDKEVDDRKIMAALLHRYNDLKDSNFEVVKLKKVPASLSKVTKKFGSGKTQAKPDVTTLVQSSIILVGGGDQFFTSGAVMISDDGLALTNYHVAEAMKDSLLVGMTTDGKTHKVIELLAGNPNRDVALIRLEGNGFTPVPIAKNTPSIGDDIVMLHHSENRFYTYDRGYVMRHPIIGDHPWMEISADYAPGGSGCGIFNDKHELVGLVSSIAYGDGPMLADQDFDMEFDDQTQPGEDEEMNDDDFIEDGLLLVKHAVPLTAIQGLWKKTSNVTKSELKANTAQ